jgi:hypothetical protein
MRKVTPFLSSVVIMAVLTLLQGLSDTGQEWAVMGMWFGLCNWFLRTPKTHPVNANQSETSAVPGKRGAHLNHARNQKPETAPRFGDSDPVEGSSNLSEARG